MIVPGADAVIRDIAPAAARHQEFTSRSAVGVDQRHTYITLAQDLASAVHSGSAGTDDRYIIRHLARPGASVSAGTCSR